MADLVLAPGTDDTIGALLPPAVPITMPTSNETLVPVRGIQGLPGEAASAPVDPVLVFDNALA